jgi:hypothetical protein
MRQTAALCFGLLTALVPVGAQVSDDGLIVPGERIGVWTMTMSIDELLQVNGPKRAIGPPEDQTEIMLRSLRDSVKDLWAHRWDHLRLRAVTFERDTKRVEGLTVSDRRFKTAQNIGIGATREEVVAAYGMPTAVTEANARQMHVIYDELGITFRVSNDQQKVDLINIFRPGTARERWKF